MGNGQSRQLSADEIRSSIDGRREADFRRAITGGELGAHAENGSFTKGARPRALVLYDPPPPYGGVRVSAANSLEVLQRIGGVEYATVRYHGEKLAAGLVNYARELHRSDIAVFMVGDIFALLSKRGFAHWLVAVLLRKPMVFRGFAGGLATALRDRPTLHQRAIGFLLRRMRLITFQTREDLAAFRDLLGTRPRLEWLPNVRTICATSSLDRPSANRFCFIGRMTSEKGVDLIREVGTLLPASIEIDLYGPCEGCEEDQFDTTDGGPGARVRYRGTIDPRTVPEVLREYDCLLLPTTWRTEGHPGVVLEAFAAGVPVIATRWNGIPELVDERCGILIEPGSVTSLRDAILVMNADADLWRRRRSGARERIRSFDPSEWGRAFDAWVHEAVGKPRRTARARAITI
jgi:glycosyltransferase involved in cell wall biosynthesis